MNERQEPEPEPGSDDLVDPIQESMETLISRAAASKPWAAERSLASGATCPDPTELDDLEAGRISSEPRRVALARHLVTCPRCFERNFMLLLGRDAAARHPGATPVAPSGPAAPETPPSRPLPFRPRFVATLLAAAAVLTLSTALLLERGMLTVDRGFAPLLAAHPTDAFGFENRGPGDDGGAAAQPRRVAIEIGQPGFVALARFTPSGIEVVDIEGRAFVAAVRAADEIVLPLDHALDCRPGDVWLVVFADHAPTDVALDEAVAKLAKGYAVPGFDALRVTPRPR